MSKKVVFSGLQPTGGLTLGNYLGAITNWVRMQNEYSCLFCLVDLHAITVQVDPELLQKNIITNFAAYLACGLDIEKSIIFNQSKVKEHSELGWILSCNTPIGWLNRMTQFKDKAGSDQEKASLGLYAYPVLMAADIMLYHATHVPVGEDQIQHIELARDVAGAFNRRYKVQYFTEPKAVVNKVATRIMSLQDGTKKMSKSDPSDLSRINIDDTPELIEKKIKKAKTDTIVGIYFSKIDRPEISNLISIYAALSNTSIDSVCSRFKNSNNSAFKRELTELLVATLQPIQKKMHELLEDKGYLLDILNKQGEKAAHMAAKTMKEVKEIVGFC